MGTVTISLKNHSERLLRALSNQKYGGRKGSMGKAVEEGIELLASREKARAAMARQLKLMRKGLTLGIKEFKREEAYA